ncbi:hypothetical protein Mar181_2728 [Marinomonas posidonica IVIA-Po-181]|uniref:DUF2927 domain-containing protein n=2 Tax=Marinomonas TaxID=28253 RepID=F6CYS7_MARPP|nr:hypothetical protein Mar181_2728 [Marinomonas posidonica IVIA-Po-181]
MIQINLNVIRCLILIFAILSSAVSVAKERWQDDSYIEDSFIKIALQREYKETNYPKIIRWKKPIRLYFESDAGDAKLQKELLSVHAQHLAYITGLSIDFTQHTSDANIFVIFTKYDQLEDKVRQYIGDPENIRAALDEAICLGNFRRNSHYEITRGAIIIPVDYARRKARFLDCIVEEITQLLGLPNDSNDVFPSVFNDVSVDTYLSPLDYILLKALYSRHIKPGMNVTQTRKLFPDVLKELHSNGDINNAAQRVQQYSLKRYLGD